MRKVVLCLCLVSGMSSLGAVQGDAVAYGGGLQTGVQSCGLGAKEDPGAGKKGYLGGQVQGFFDVGYVLSSMTSLGLFLQGGMNFGGLKCLKYKQKTSFGGGLMVGQHVGNAHLFLGGGVLLTAFESNIHLAAIEVKKRVMGIHAKLGIDVDVAENFSVGLQGEGTFYGKIPSEATLPGGKKIEGPDFCASSVGASVRFKFHN